MLILTNTAALANLTTPMTLSKGTLNLLSNASATFVSPGLSAVANGSPYVYVGPLNGSGSGTVTLGGTVTVGNSVTNGNDRFYVNGAAGYTLCLPNVALAAGGTHSELDPTTANLIVGNITSLSTSAETLTLAGTLSNSVTGTISEGSAATSLLVNSGGTWTLSGSNGYSGSTTVSGGMLELGQRGSLYGANTASWTAGNIVVQSGATLVLAVGGANAFTASDVGTLLGLSTSSNNGFESGSILGLDTGGGGFAYGNAIANPNNGAKAHFPGKAGTKHAYAVG